MDWSPSQYSRFEQARNRPIIDLLARLADDEVIRAVDIGCGPGNSTEQLRQRFPNAVIEGLDSSAEMIASARTRLPDVVFHVADIASWSADPACDLILANAVLHWLPDHERLFPRLLAQLAPGGRLALQMPDNLDEPAHVRLREVAGTPRWSDRLSGVGAQRAPQHEAHWYVRCLEARTAEIDIWRTTHHHRLAGGVDALIEWFKGAALRPYLERLSKAEAQDFISDYRDAVDGAYPVLDDGALLLSYPRLFMVLTKPGNT